MDEQVRYFPENDLTTLLLNSIPKKVVNWLATLQSRYNVSLIQSHPGRASWGYSGKRIRLLINSGDVVSSELAFGEFGEDDYVALWWEGDADTAQNIRVSDLTLVDAAFHIDTFVETEKKFYDELELLERELEYRFGTVPSNDKFDLDKAGSGSGSPRDRE